MTTVHSPLGVLKAQADKIASMIKAAERGETIDRRFEAKLQEARAKDVFKVGIVMDDKTIIIDLPWTVIRSTDEAGLAAYILKHMQERRDNG